jgi:hypothetical protein
MVVLVLWTGSSRPVCYMYFSQVRVRECATILSEEDSPMTQLQTALVQWQQTFYDYDPR